MRRLPIVVLLALVGCVGEPVQDGSAAPVEPVGSEPSAAERLPAALAELRLLEDHPSISSVAFPHARHVDPAVMGGEVACATCHHALDDDPAAIPQRCTACHEYAYLMPEVDEDAPHTHDQPPDL